MNCSFCNEHLNFRVNKYSLDRFDISLCISHQHWFKKALTENYNTRFVLQLFLRLKELGANPILNKRDGHKTVDIGIKGINIHIEVDGVHHNTNSNQAMSDLKRTYHDMEIGIYTIRIPNSLVKDNLNECSEYLMKIIDVGKSNSTIISKNKTHSYQ